MRTPKRPIRNAVALTREDWVRAATTVIAKEGVSAVAVEPLAQSLGVTKGSFYWHFKTRDALIHAVLEAWEQDQSDDVVTRYQGIANPRQRLRVLLFAAFEDLENGRFLAALTVSSEDPRVKPYLRRATARRLAFGVASFRALGLEEQEAQERALLAYAAYAGYFQLLRTATPALTAVPDLSGFVRRLADALVPQELH